MLAWTFLFCGVEIVCTNTLRLSILRCLYHMCTVGITEFFARIESLTLSAYLAGTCERLLNGLLRDIALF